MACEGNSRTPSKKYQQLYPNWKQPSRNTFATIHYSLRETDVFMRQHMLAATDANVQSEEEVLDAVHTNPLISTCQVTYETDLSQNAV
jgi:hypothetical protein